MVAVSANDPNVGGIVWTDRSKEEVSAGLEAVGVGGGNIEGDKV